MSRLYNYFLSCRTANNITEAQLQAAVDKGYITTDELTTILATPKLTT